MLCLSIYGRISMSHLTSYLSSDYQITFKLTFTIGYFLQFFWQTFFNFFSKISLRSKSPIFLFGDQKEFQLLFFFWTLFGQRFWEFCKKYIQTFIIILKKLFWQMKSKVLDFRFYNFRFLAVKKCFFFMAFYLSKYFFENYKSLKIDYLAYALHVALRT